MRTYVGPHRAVSDSDFLELALGTPPELWLGVDGESAPERAAREDAARDILADHPHLPDAVSRVAVRVFPRPAPAARRRLRVSRGAGVAA